VAPAPLLSRAPLLSGGGSGEGADAAAAVAAAAAQEEALKQPGGIFEGLWLLPTEVAPEPSDSEPEEEVPSSDHPVTPTKQQQQQGSALAAAAPDGDGAASTLQLALGEGGDTVDTLLADNAGALAVAAAGTQRATTQAATAAAAARSKVGGWLLVVGDGWKSKGVSEGTLFAVCSAACKPEHHHLLFASWLPPWGTPHEPTLCALHPPPPSLSRGVVPATWSLLCVAASLTWLPPGRVWCRVLP
jgi:hypothetical protein